MFTPEAERYSSSGFDAPPPPPARAESGYYDDEGAFGSSEATTIFDSPAYDGLSEDTAPVRTRDAGWHAGLDLGLLVLRLALGALLVAHSFQHLFGWFQGDGINGTRALIEQLGFRDHTTLLTWITGLTELGAGVLIILGLFTVIGASALLGLVGTLIWTKFSGRQFAGDVELETLYAVGAFALLMMGPGRVSLDRPTPWYRYATAFGVVFLLVAGGAMVTVLLVFR